MKLRLLLISLACATSACSNASAQGTPPVVAAASETEQKIAAIDAALEEAVANGFGGAVIIHQGPDVLLSKGYGFADRERRVRFTPETIAQIGSITKSQTGAAIATLIAAGKIELDAPVGRYIPEAPEPGRSRTIAQLLAHSSGLLDICGGDFEPMPERKLISDCLGRPLAHPPGEDQYSNTGYSVLALITQRVTAQLWEEVVRANVWQPLGMRDIGFDFRGKNDDLFARGYLKGAKQPVISRSIERLDGNDWALRGNGGIQASSTVMIRFLNGILDPAGGLPPEARRQLLAPVPGESGEVREGYGLAFRYEPDGTLIRMGHAGSDGTFFSYLGWLSRNDVRLYFVGNNGEPEVRPLLQQVLRTALELPPAS